MSAITSISPAQIQTTSSEPVSVAPIGVNGFALASQCDLDALTMGVGATTETARERARFDDLGAFSSSPEAVRAEFKRRYENMEPDGISLNSETRFNAVKPAITEQYGYWCDKVLGPVVFASNLLPPSSELLASEIVQNTTNSEIEVEVTITGRWKELEMFLLMGMNWSRSITLTGQYHDGIAFNENIPVNQRRVREPERASTTRVKVKVPPRSRVTVKMIGERRTERLTSRPTVTLEGWFGANFPHRVRGHYFWFESAASFVKQAEMHGFIERRSYVTSIEIDEPQQLGND
jgi:hypothetical protein